MDFQIAGEFYNKVIASGWCEFSTLSKKRLRRLYLYAKTEPSLWKNIKLFVYQDYNENRSNTYSPYIETTEPENNIYKLRYDLKEGDGYCFDFRIKYDHKNIALSNMIIEYDVLQ